MSLQKRIIVQELIAEQFLNRVLRLFDSLKIDDPMNPDTDIPPLSSENAVEEDAEMKLYVLILNQLS
ncbi:aldehyde dehydrogenase family protein [Chryseobacterium jejuense]|uniref:Succinic semialdehyde dehydrogenase n=1 Tax=Chryseobacterium jejuense TaxID=445960 RepID=A0A2X2XKT1_CHRJE|nr:aldehyde dehydrogenase family protein [Chryseobacterium jejuense]SQB26960.1 succinic semialdehyde dehydrogenase [Chryseobacterium jejuense]